MLYKNVENIEHIQTLASATLLTNKKFKIYVLTYNQIQKKRKKNQMFTDTNR